jgi:myo-inositol-1(or 4)-monophosphatase
MNYVRFLTDNMPMSSMSTSDDLQRITSCLHSVGDFIRQRDRRALSVSYSRGGDPSTSLDREINQFLRERLPRVGEGWLSEEDKDDPRRLKASRVWIVDPIDGTREFVEGCPEWCVSIGLVEGNEAVAGGVLNPSTGEMFWGSHESGLQTSGHSNAGPSNGHDPEQTAVSRLLVSRREYSEGKWKSFHRPDIAVVPVGSIAYRLARVAAGYADATCTFETRHEWDVAGGVALLMAAGGRVVGRDGAAVRFNQERPKLQSLFAYSGNCSSLLPALCELHKDKPPRPAI